MTALKQRKLESHLGVFGQKFPQGNWKYEVRNQFEWESLVFLRSHQDYMTEFIRILQISSRAVGLGTQVSYMLRLHRSVTHRHIMARGLVASVLLLFG